jgi:cytochrome c oxidase subunit III
VRARATQDVSSLPTEVFGPGNVTWWGALGGEVIEGFVLVLAVFAYLYLRHEAPDWPPLHTPLPSLRAPTINLALMVLSVIAAWWAAHSARAKNRWATFAGLTLHMVLGTAILVIRYFECYALNVRWDTNAYGSVTWAILFSHGYMALFDIFDTGGLAILCLFLQPEERHYVDVTENSFFWYFVVATWFPLFVLVFLSPRWMPR